MEEAIESLVARRAAEEANHPFIEAGTSRKAKREKEEDRRNDAAKAEGRRKLEGDSGGQKSARPPREAPVQPPIPIDARPGSLLPDRPSHQSPIGFPPQIAAPGPLTGGGMWMAPASHPAGSSHEPPSPIELDSWALGGVLSDGLGSPLESPDAAIPTAPVPNPIGHLSLQPPPGHQYSLWDGNAVPGPDAGARGAVTSTPAWPEAAGVGLGLGGGIWDSPSGSAPTQNPW